MQSSSRLVLDKSVLKQVHAEDDEQTPAWMRYMSTITEGQAVVDEGRTEQQGGGAPCPATEVPSSNPFAAHSVEKTGALRRSSRASRHNATAPYNTTTTVLRKRINVDETALLLSFLK